MSAVAVETMLEEIEPWELHSELALVSPEVCKRALELLPERDPEAFLTRPREAIVPAALADESDEASFRTVVLRYTLWRLAQSARLALALALGSIGVALIAEVLH